MNAKRTFALGAAVISIVATSIAIAAPAQAACPESGKVCYWENANFQSQQFGYTSDQTSLGSMNDKFSSMNNQTAWKVWSFEDTNYGGRWFGLNSGSFISNLAGLGTNLGPLENWNDRISSFYF